MALDMEHLRKVFYQECRENLEILENELLALNPDGEVDLEVINTIFRAAHSIKGGGATFELDEISQFTHSMETLLDEAREGRRQLNRDSIDVLLQGGDCIREMLEAYESNTAINPQRSAQVTVALTELLSIPAESTESRYQPQADEVTCQSGQDFSADSQPECWQIQFTPHREMFFSGNDPVRILRELQALDNTCQSSVDLSSLPALEEIEPELCYLSWTIWLDGQVSREDIEEIFEWVTDECELDIVRGKRAEQAVEAGASDSAIKAYESLTEAISPPELQPRLTAESSPEPVLPDQMLSPSNPDDVPAPLPAVADSRTAVAASSRASSSRHGNSVSSIRVDIEKVDELINLVGELVITQSMLTELGQDFDPSKLDRLQAGLDLLLQNTKELQESVLNIRMLPISFAFNRFPRLVRDLSTKLEKQVELNISGEQTELDKTVLERITDPLVHLVRNAIDHGIEVPSVRQEKGKPAVGTITLDAYHQGGSIVILVRDDGAGLDCDKLWQKAVEKSLIPSGGQREDFSRGQIYNLIFAPGFSTAEQVSDISGRGVGMDVVKRNIEELGGHIEVDSTPAQGSCFTISLPLTLAILDGQLVKVASQVFVIPLLTIIESVQMQPERLKVAAGGVELYQLREENVPIVRLDEVFDLGNSEGLEGRLLCLVEAGGNRIGLLLDELLGQQQVVIKSLESNYTKVEGISGATILGDGSVSLILDIQGLITAHATGRNIAARSAKRIDMEMLQQSAERQDEQGVAERVLPTEPQLQVSTAAEEVLGFVLADELYGIDIQCIEEIRVWETPTPIPRTPDFIKGVINLRGMIVPVMDLRIRFGIGHADYLKTTVVLVLRAQTEHGDKMMGIVVDAVSDVVDISRQEIGQAVGETPVTPYVTGIVNVEQKVMTLLSVEQLLSIERLIPS